MKYVDVKNTINDLINNWNEEFKNYPLSERLIKEKLLEHKDHVKSYSILSDDNEYIASIILKKCLRGNILNGYISLVYVNKKYRHQGIGTMMINDAIEYFRNEDVPSLWLGCDYGCLYSGLFIDNNEDSHKFFLNRGFLFDHNTHNLLLSKKIDIDLNLGSEFKYTLLEENRREEFLDFVLNTFSFRWYNENIKTDCKDVVLILKDDKIVAFARICMKDSKVLTNGINNYLKYENEGRVLGALGPLGVARELRKTGLGKQIVLYGVSELFKRGASDILVDWTSLVEFYKKVCFEDICDVYSQYRYDY